MLILSDKRYVPTAVNMIVLQDNVGRFYYVHRSLYDQAVILHDSYTEPATIYGLLGHGEAIPEACKLFAETVPAPLNVLAPFLTLVKGHEELTTLEDMCGAISAMSMSVNFRQMLRVPLMVRQSVKFSLLVREEYRVQWDRFFAETPTLEQVSFSTPREPAALGTFVAHTAEPTTAADDSEYGDEWLEAMLEACNEVEPFKVESEPEEVVSAAPSGFNLLKGLV